MSFALVIPALNEEQAIGSTLERSLAARREVLERTSVTEMQVIFVNDGSTDRTQAIADRYPEVIKVRFERNQGYGAAIKAGFQATDAELVGFMDADGTCDPRFCVQLINRLLEHQADVAVGNRMTSESEMPFIRRLGNRIFARLIGAVSGKELSDSASGMRVLRRSSLKMMYPLPDGLHFTPAMTCLAHLDPRLKMVEVPMPYKERVGRSKLRVIKDGLRFLFIILFTAALFNPIKSLAVIGLLFWLLGLGLVGTAGRLGESPLLMGVLTGAFGVVFAQAVFVGVLCHQMLHMLIGPWGKSGLGDRLLQKYFWTMRLVRASIAMLVVGLLTYAFSFLLPAAWHSVLMFTAAFLVVVAGWTALAGVALRVIWAAKQRRMAEIEDPFASKATSGQQTGAGDATVQTTANGETASFASSPE